MVVFSVRTWSYVVFKVEIVLFVIIKVEMKTSELVICKARRITCISYLQMKMVFGLVYLQFERVTSIVIRNKKRTCNFQE